MRVYRFYKDDGWFIDLPGWEGDKSDLQMVRGADTFLDILSQGEDSVYVTLSKNQFEGSDTLHYECQGLLEGPEYGEGAWYFLNEFRGIPYSLRLWLCDVTKFVFNEYPVKIYFKANS